MNPGQRLSRATAASVPALTLIAGLLLCAGSTMAQPGPAEPAATPAADSAGTADLVLVNRAVVTFRGSLLGASPQGRVAAAGARIRALIRRGPPGPVGSRPGPDAILVTIGPETVFVLTAGDLDPATGESLEQLRDRTVASLSAALAEMEEGRSVRRLLRSLLLASLATAVFLLLFWFLRWMTRRLEPRLQLFARRHAQRVALGEFTILTGDQAAVFIRRLDTGVRWVVMLTAAYAWLTFVLKRFPYTRPWGERLGVHLWGTASTIGGAVIGSIPGLFLVVIIFVGTRWAAQLLAGFFTAVREERITVPGLYPDTVPATRRIVNVVLWLFALALAFPHLPGSESAAFKGVSLFTGLMISLGSTALIGQVLSGFMIIYSRSLRVGDYVRVGQTEGRVTSIGFFATRIQTPKQEQVTIPNSVVLAAETKNYTLSAGPQGVILYTSVTIGYGTPWRQVHAMLLLAAGRTPGLKKDPPPFVAQTALTDFYVEYQLNAHLEKPEERLRTLALLHANIQDAFNEHGVQILSPHYEADPPAPVVVPRERWHEPPASPPGGQA